MTPSLRALSARRVLAGGLLAGLPSCASPAPAVPPPPASPAPVAVVSGAPTGGASPAPGDDPAAAPDTSSTSSTSNASSTSSAGGPGAARTLQDVVGQQRGALARACWQPVLDARKGEAQSARAEVTLAVAAGRVARVEVRGVSPSLSSCLEQNIRPWGLPATIAPGEETFILAFVGRG